MNRAIYDKEVPTKNLVTTITGVISLVISGLTLFQILEPDDAASLGEYSTMIVTAVAGIVGIFKAKDA